MLIKKMFQNLKLAKKITILLLTMIVILIIGELISRKMIYQAYDRQLYQQTAQVLTSYIDRIETELKELDTVSLSYITDQGVQKGFQELNELERNQDSWLEARQNVGQQLSGYFYRIDYLSNIRIVVNNQVVYGSRLDRLNMQDAVNKAREAKGAMTFFVSDKEVYMLRQVRKSAKLSLEEMGVVIGKLDLNKLVQKCRAHYWNIGLDPQIAIYDGEQCISGDADNILLKEDGWMRNQDYFFVQSSSTQLGWRFLVKVSYAEVYASLQKVYIQSIVLVLIVAFLVVFAGNFMIHFITGHLEKLIKKIDLYGRGIVPDVDRTDIYRDRRDEIGKLHRHFDKMAIQNSKLTKEHYDAMLLLKEAEFKQLEKQIHPHFLFNTLSTIVWTAYEHQDAQTAVIAQKLAQILRATIRKKQDTVPLSEEVELAGTYIEIQKARYGENLFYACNIEEKLQDVMIPSMTLQPIIENSVLHGMENLLEPLHINVTGYCQNGTVFLTVEDNGGGMPEDVLEQLETGKIQASGTGIGLRNIQKRIQLLFSEEYGLRFEKEENRMRVIVVLPETRQQETDKEREECTN